MAPKGRAPRPKTSYFDSEDLFEELRELSKLKDPGFKWDGSTYQKPTRSTSADHEGLFAHRKALEVLLKVAPTGFPSHSDLKATFVKLHKKEQVFEGVRTDDAGKTLKAATEAADIWRIMCRDLYNLRKLEVKDHKVQFLVDMIELSTKEDGSTGGDDIVMCDDKDDDEQRSGVVSFPDFDSLVDPDLAADDFDSQQAAANFDSQQAADDFDSEQAAENFDSEQAANNFDSEQAAANFDSEQAANNFDSEQAADDSDVEIVAMQCRCPVCSKVDTGVSRGSAPIPSAKSGGQRIETVGKKEKMKATNKKAMKAIKVVSAKTKAVLSQRIKLPIKIAERKTSKCGKQPEMYILHSVAKNSYVCGQKQSQSSSYRENIKAVAKEIEEGKITTVKAAREWLSGRGK